MKRLFRGLRRPPDPSYDVVVIGSGVGGLIAGGYEREPAPWALDGIPPDFNGKLLPPDWDRFAPLLENAVRRVPALEAAEVVQLVNGPEGFTPDGEYLLGPTGVKGFWVAAAFCAHGLAGAGGIVLIAVLAFVFMGGKNDGGEPAPAVETQKNPVLVAKEKSEKAWAAAEQANRDKPLGERIKNLRAALDAITDQTVMDRAEDRTGSKQPIAGTIPTSRASDMDVGVSRVQDEAAPRTVVAGRRLSGSG